MPNPAKYKTENKTKFMRDCLHITRHREHLGPEHSLAKCLNMWRQHHPSKKDKFRTKKAVENVITGFLNRVAGYPDHPDDIVISKSESLIGSELSELDVYSYYSDGVVTEMLKELKGRDLFIGMKLKGQTGKKPLYIRHPYDKKTEYIRISNRKDFNKYRSGRMVEVHVTMPATCDTYVVDFDAVGDWSKTKKIAGEIADGLEKLPGGTVSIRYTGKRGFHILKKIKPVPIDSARETLKEWLKTTFGDRDDVVVGESPSGSKGALGVSPMKLNGGQVALWSLRVTGLCCVEVPRSKLDSFKREDASLERTYKKLTGKSFTRLEEKKAAERIVTAFQNSHPQSFGTGWADDFASTLGLGPKYKPEPIKTYECKTCHKTNAYYKEDHPDTDMNEIILYCPDCHAEN